MQRLLLPILVACALGGCRPAQTSPDAGAGDLIWVVQTFSGGRQCEPREDYSPPDTRQLLAESGVEVFETAVELLGVCMACECPVYAAQHFARIRPSDLDAAAVAGFSESGGPPPAPQ